jgi:hypothetical protein
VPQELTQANNDADLTKAQAIAKARANEATKHDPSQYYVKLAEFYGEELSRVVEDIGTSNIIIRGKTVGERIADGSIYEIYPSLRPQIE